MRGDVLLNGTDQFGDALEHAALQAIGREAAEKALDHVEPGCRGRREVQMEARMFFQPRLDGGSVCAWRNCHR